MEVIRGTPDRDLKEFMEDSNDPYANNPTFFFNVIRSEITLTDPTGEHGHIGSFTLYPVPWGSQHNKEEENIKLTQEIIGAVEGAIPPIDSRESVLLRRIKKEHPQAYNTINGYLGATIRLGIPTTLQLAMYLALSNPYPEVNTFPEQVIKVLESGKLGKLTNGYHFGTPAGQITARIAPNSAPFLREGELSIFEFINHANYLYGTVGNKSGRCPFARGASTVGRLKRTEDIHELEGNEKLQKIAIFLLQAYKENIIDENLLESLYTSSGLTDTELDRLSKMLIGSNGIDETAKSIAQLLKNYFNR
jgi:hypothetical protein